MLDDGEVVYTPDYRATVVVSKGFYNGLSLEGGHVTAATHGVYASGSETGLTRITDITGTPSTSVITTDDIYWVRADRQEQVTVLASVFSGDEVITLHATHDGVAWEEITLPPTLIPLAHCVEPLRR